MKKIKFEGPRIVEVVGRGSEGLVPLHPTSCPHRPAGEIGCVSMSGGSMCAYLGAATVGYSDVPPEPGQRFVLCVESVEVEVCEDVYKIEGNHPWAGDEPAP